MTMEDAIEGLIEACTWRGGEIDLRKRPTRVEGAYESPKGYRDGLQRNVKRLTSLQRRLFIERRQALLIILQGLDTAGKDGIIRHVIRAFNPQGCRVYSFRTPTSEEVAHDFLWRTTRYLPERGQISVFNRSHYEEVLVVRVHPEFLDAQHVDGAAAEEGSIWQTRYESILAQEKHLLASGTRVVKLMLHISPEEQALRLIARMSNPNKSWKFQEQDLEERRFWDDYLAAYSACIGATSTREAPWYVVPADDKRTARLLAAGIIAQTLEDMELSEPEVSAKRAGELSAMKKRLGHQEN
jgi:PPK2 family polyphosphate:nucleotide phosphotransferase